MEFNRSLALVTIGILILAAILFLTIPIFLSSSLVAGSGKNTSVSFSQAIGQFKNTTQTVLVHIIPDRNTVLFNSHSTNLVVLSVDSQQAQNLTESGSSSGQGPISLLIAGLIFPQVNVQPNASITIVFINMAPDQSCNFIVSTINPSSISNSGVQVSQQLGAILVTPDLAPANLTTGKVYQYTAALPSIPDNLWYTSSCTPSVYGAISNE
ncbi:MAG: hypothetical protein KGH71_05590 [Candidatus Micrarchaeota archaeon]|nr:hypothetical protein [Candidatus Micrarchaeota archaeon]